MLKSFKVSGFTSIIDPISINFMAPENRRIKNTKYEDNFFENRIAKSVVLFGGNATGKTNILKAVNKICNIIQNGLNSNNANDIKNIEKYEIEFLIDKSIYSYILEFSSEKLIYEKLSKNSEQIYEFKNDKLTFKSKKDFEAIFSVVSKDTILYKLSDNKVEDINNVIRETDNVAFSETLNSFEVISNFEPIVFDEENREYFKQHKDEILEIVKILDNSIDDYCFFPFNGGYVLQFIRNFRGFFLDKESSGIKKIFSLVKKIVSNLKLNASSIMLIDELDSSISTTSLIRLLNGFINSSINTKAQFIVTSHNPLIFDTNMLSPTQIYIVGKEDCKTTIKCLDEFELRNDKRKAYLNYLRGDYE